MTEQLHRGRLGPLNIVEQNHERADRGQSRQHIADRLEQQVPLGGVVTDRSAGKFDAVGQAWRDADQVPSAAPDVGPQHVRRRVLDQMPDQRPEWLQRHGGPVLATPVEHRGCALVSYRAGERAQHGRLADPRLALHDDGP